MIPFYFKLQSYFDTKKYWNDEEQEWTDEAHATLYTGELKYGALDGPKLLSKPELYRHELCNLIPQKVERL